MVETIASLGFVVDSSQAVSAAGDLDRLDAASGRAAAGAERFNRSAGGVGQAARQAGGAVQSYAGAFTNALRSQEQAVAASQRLRASFIGIRQSVLSVQGALAGFGVSLGIGNAVREFADFETALIGVGKTADLQGAELQAFADRITSLAQSEVPVATNELLNIAATAAQLGVEGTANLERFTTTIAKLASAAPSIGGEEAATALARLLNVTGEGIGTVDTLASVLVQLGNNFATTERAILRTASEVGRSTAQFGIASSEILGISTALSQVGVQAEVGGSVVGRVFREIAAASSEGGAALQGFATIAGTTGEQFAAVFANDPTAAFQAFVNGLGAVNDAGGNVASVLEQLGLRGDEINKVIPALASNTEAFARALATAADEAANATALNEEAERAFDSFASDLQRFQNTVSATARVFGAELAPAVRALADQLASGLQSGAITAFAQAVGAAATAIANNIGLITTAVGTLAALTTARFVGNLVTDLISLGGGALTAARSIGGLPAVIRTAATGVSGFAGIARNAIGAIATFAASFTGLTSAFGLAGAASIGLRAALAAVTGPIGLAVTAATLAAGAFVAFSGEAEAATTSTRRLEEAQEAISAITGDVTASVQDQTAALDTYAESALAAAEADLRAAQAALAASEARKRAAIDTGNLTGPGALGAAGLNIDIDRDTAAVEEAQATLNALQTTINETRTALASRLETGNVNTDSVTGAAGEIAGAGNQILGELDRLFGGVGDSATRSLGAARQTFDEFIGDLERRRDVEVARLTITSDFDEQGQALQTELRVLEEQARALDLRIQIVDPDEEQRLRAVIGATIEAQEAVRRLNALRDARTGANESLAVAQRELELVGASTQERQRDLEILRQRQALLAQDIPEAAVDREIELNIRPVIDQTAVANAQRAIAEQINSLEQSVAAEQRRTQVLALHPDLRESELAVLNAIAAAEQEVGSLTATQTANIRAVIDEREAQKAINDEIIEQEQRIEEVSRSAAGAIASALGEFVTEGGNVLDFLDQLEDRLIRIGSQALIEQPLTDFLTAGFSDLGRSFLPGSTPSADAGAGAVAPANDNAAGVGAVAEQTAASLVDLTNSAATVATAFGGVSAQSDVQTQGLISNVAELAVGTAAKTTETAATTAQTAAKTTEATSTTAATAALSGLAAAASAASAALSTVAASSAAGSAANFIPGFFHEGGIVGLDKGSAARPVSPSLFIGAPRYHSGLAGNDNRAVSRSLGLRDDEFPAILQRGEAVIPLTGGAVSVANENGQLVAPLPNGQRVPVAFDDDLMARLFSGAPRFHTGYDGGTDATAGFARTVSNPGQLFQDRRLTVEARVQTPPSMAPTPTTNNNQTTQNFHFHGNSQSQSSDRMGWTPNQIARRVGAATVTSQRNGRAA